MLYDYFCIFAGGGMRGSAYLGVLKAMQECNINITGIAGSSVGALFASAYAVGFTYEELTDIVFSMNYESFRDLNFSLGKDFAICKGDNFYNWVKNLIEKKFYGESYVENGNKPVTFADIDKELVIIATNISRATFEEFSKSKTPDVEIALAVRASVSVPGLFKPVWNENGCLVDGDIVCNFPIWAFANLINKENSSRILEFRLESAYEDNQIKNPFDYLNSIFDTHYNIATDILLNNYGQSDLIDIIRINTNTINIIDFSVSNKTREELVKNGYNSCLNYLTNNLINKKTRILNIYKDLCLNLGIIKEEIEKNKIGNTLLTLEDLSISLIDNVNFIDKSIFNSLYDFIKEYRNNLFYLKIIPIKMIRNKKDILIRIVDIQNLLDFKINDLRSYIRQNANQSLKMTSISNK